MFDILAFERFSKAYMFGFLKALEGRLYEIVGIYVHNSYLLYRIISLNIVSYVCAYFSYILCTCIFLKYLVFFVFYVKFP